MNILHYRLVIADLGLAKVFDVDLATTTIDIVTPYWLLPERSQFVSTAACGSPAYCAPERICSYKYSFEADIWSLGVCVYEMLTVRLPWYDDDLKVMAHRIVTEDLEFKKKDNVDQLTRQFVEQVSFLAHVAGY
jgi:serine/threonine protein kinase